MSSELPETLRQVIDSRSHVDDLTPARLLLGRAGTAYRTSTQLQLRADHAFAKDALGAELALDQDPMLGLVNRCALFDISTEAVTHQEYLARPDKGRRLSADSVKVLRENCTTGVDVQVVIGDGLSPLAVSAQVPGLIEPLLEQLKLRGWTVGRPFLIRHCRVGVMNDIGDVLEARNVVLLIGERPGLATAESLSAYLAHVPRTGHTDAQRNLVSNIHPSGVRAPEAVKRIVGFIDSFELHGRSGFMVKESTQPTTLPGSSGR